LSVTKNVGGECHLNKWKPKQYNERI